MIEEQAKFERWKSRVDVYLEQMVKKLSGDFKYDYLHDFQNKVPPSITATRVVKRQYRNGVENGSNSIRSQGKWQKTPR
jgi:hypothetical protein